MKPSLISAEIHLPSVAHNVRELRRITSPSARFMAVVKANAYGHGAVPVAMSALQNGADALGVARIEEGIQLREAGIKAPILIFGHTDPDLAPALIDFELTPTVFSFRTAERLSGQASARGKSIRVHIKVDTGMGRIGLLPDTLREPDNLASSRSLTREISRIARLPGLEIEGIYTHFACADTGDKSYTRQQLALFLEITERLFESGVHIPLRHAANSGALISYPETHLDMVRPGISLYGLYPSADVDQNRVSLQPAMTFKASIVQLKEVPPGFSISYGRTYTTDKKTRIATVSVGYADGLNRRLSSRGQMLVHGIKAPVVGRVCMDLTLIDVGHISNVRIGDEAVIFGTQNGAVLPVDEIAATLGTINYEVVTGISERVPRVYTGG
ncbi:MAG: alanine racemase [Pseudomonadota bacterium]